MAFMSRESTRSKRLSEEEIDEIVIAEADNDAAWEAPVKVNPYARTSFALPRDLAARAAFLARLHHVGRIEEWLTRVIRERVELEETAFAEAKREIAGGSGRRSR